MGQKKGLTKKINDIRVRKIDSKLSYDVDSSKNNFKTINVLDSLGRKQGVWYEQVVTSILSPGFHEYYAVGYYIDGVKNRTWRYYSYKGHQLFFAIDYVDGTYNGKILCYDNKGNKTGEYVYSNGNKNGNYLSYYSNGKIYEKACFKDGNFVGEYFKYNKKGKLIKYIKNAQVEFPYK